jgi:hypothetical protein
LKEYSLSIRKDLLGNPHPNLVKHVIKNYHSLTLSEDIRLSPLWSFSKANKIVLLLTYKNIASMKKMCMNKETKLYKNPKLRDIVHIMG